MAHTGEVVDSALPYSVKRWPFICPGEGPLKCSGCLEHGAVIKAPPDNLEADGQAVVCPATGY